ncbi:unnamed protein product [Prorocentrum cordatum]|uniref:Uncharacterized protein n=1 Tax=Prorocentrum cordatum TaxID=2364126 RepID=A0ABN9STP7_9DINO|nr:unnamed protein product [Polarella glacialis]
MFRRRLWFRRSITTAAAQAEAVGLLLGSRADASARGPKGVSPLHAAAFAGDAGVLKLLIESRDLEVRDQHGQTPLFFAPRGEICALLADANADVDRLNKKGQTALHLAANAGIDEVVEWLCCRMSPGLINAQVRATAAWDDEAAQQAAVRIQARARGFRDRERVRRRLVEKVERDGCTFWEVVLGEGDSRTEPFGFSFVSGKELAQIDAQRPIPLGLEWEDVEHESLKELKVTAVSPDGLLEASNQRFIEQGLFHYVVCPGMRIEAVSGVTGNVGLMSARLMEDSAVRLKIRRAEVATMAREKLKRRLCAWRGLKFGGKRRESVVAPPPALLGS